MTLHKMVPVAFGASGHKLFGAYHAAHAPDGAARRACGIVLCNPIGWEAIASQRSYRELGDRLAAMGFPVLRFDYSGTGDSPGTDLESGRVRAWVDSIGQAVQELKRLSGATEVSLFGVQLGATLAAVFASEARDASVSSLVLWAPYLTGRAFLRQVRAYRMLNDPGASAVSSGDEEAAGFVMLKETVEELGKIDLLAWPSPPAKKVLVIGRDTQSPEERLVARLRQLGGSVEFARLDGYVSMMQEPRKSVPPAAVFERVTAWLSTAHAGTAAGPLPAPPGEPAEIEDHEVREQAMFFGKGSRLFGILTHSTTMPRSRPLPTIVWLNTAADHRVGPNRLYVILARRLSRLGFTSFRFDPSGVGDADDAESTAKAHPYSQERLADLKEVLDWLAGKHLGERFVLVGLCSAGFVAFHAALDDRRVISEILINPQTFVWREGDSLELTVRKSYGSNRFYMQQLLKRQTWERAIRGKVNLRGIAQVVGERLLTRVARRARRLLPVDAGGPLDIERAFRRKLQHGTDVLFVFAENDGGLDYIEGHLGRNATLLRRAPRFRFEVVSGADHTFSQRWAQSWLSALISDHLVSRFGR